MHTDLVTVLKRYQKGNQATFALLRQPQEVRNIWSGGDICKVHNLYAGEQDIDVSRTPLDYKGYSIRKSRNSAFNGIR